MNKMAAKFHFRLQFSKTHL